MTLAFPFATIALIIAIACAVAIVIWLLEKVGILPAGALKQPPFIYVVYAALAFVCLWLLWLVASAFGA